MREKVVTMKTRQSERSHERYDRMGPPIMILPLHLCCPAMQQAAYHLFSAKESDILGTLSAIALFMSLQVIES